MNFDDAIKCHVEWKMKLAAYINKPDHSLNSATVGADNNCELGKWLHGEGQKYAKVPEYSALLSDHGRFHNAAAEVVRKADSGRSVIEDTTLGGNSPFASASSAVVRSLMAMKSKV